MPNLLKCVRCGELRNAESEFHFNGQYYKDGVKKKRKDCVYCCRKRRSEYFKNPEKKLQINKRRRRHYQTDGGARRERNKRNSLKQLYGLTIERFHEMRKEQNYCCACCGLHESKSTKGTLYVDHDHSTGKVRALLCNRCNIILGQFDTVDKLKRAMALIGLINNGVVVERDGNYFIKE